MSLFKKFFGKSEHTEKTLNGDIFDIEKLIASGAENSSIIAIDNYICELCAWGDDLNKLTDDQKNFFYNQNLEREINNGGFEQYFFNSSGNFAHETVQSLKIIKAFKTALLLESAIDQFPKGMVPKERNGRQDVLSAIGEAAGAIWGDLDQGFYLYQDDLNNLNMEYVRRNKENFNSYFIPPLNESR